MKYFVLATLFLSMNAQASLHHAPKAVARFVEKKLESLEKAFSENENFTAPVIYQGASEQGYYLKRIRLQYAHFAAFKVSMLELKIVPSVEFRWSRKNPKGWVNYKRPSVH